MTRLAVLLLTAAVLLPGCSHRRNANVAYQSAARESSVHLRFYGYETDIATRTVIEGVIEEFNLSHPEILVTYEGLSLQNGYGDVLGRRLMTQDGNDIFMLTPGLIRQLGWGEQLGDLSDAETLPLYAPELLEPLRDPDGRLLALPLALSPTVLYSNIELLERYGLAVPSDYLEFLWALNVVGQEQAHPLVMDSQESPRVLLALRSLSPVLASGGSDLLERSLVTGDPALGAVFYPGLQLLERIHTFEWASLYPGGTAGETQAVEDFSRGGRPFLIANLRAARPLFQSAGFSFAVTGLPLRDGSDILLLTPDSMVAVNAHSEHREAALHFIEHLTGGDALARYADAIGAASPHRDMPLLADPLLADISQILFIPGNVNEFDVGLNAERSLNLPLEQAALSVLQGTGAQSAAAALTRSVTRRHASSQREEVVGHEGPE